MASSEHCPTYINNTMARKTATRQPKSERAILIGAGITEKWYFTHLRYLYDLKIKIRPRYFGKESVFTLEKLIRNVLDNEGLAIVVFDTDVSAWDDKEKERLQRLIRTYSNNKRVILCDSMPSIEFWFLIHYIDTNKYFGTSKAVIDELGKHIHNFDKKESFLESIKWVAEMCKDGKLHKAYLRAKNIGTVGESYTNLWKAIDYLGILAKGDK